MAVGLEVLSELQFWKNIKEVVLIDKNYFFSHLEYNVNYSLGGNTEFWTLYAWKVITYLHLLFYSGCEMEYY